MKTIEVFDNVDEVMAFLIIDGQEKDVNLRWNACSSTVYLEGADAENIQMTDEVRKKMGSPEFFEKLIQDKLNLRVKIVSQPVSVLEALDIVYNGVFALKGADDPAVMRRKCEEMYERLRIERARCVAQG